MKNGQHWCRTATCCRVTQMASSGLLFSQTWQSSSKATDNIVHLFSQNNWMWRLNWVKWSFTWNHGSYVSARLPVQLSQRWFYSDSVSDASHMLPLQTQIWFLLHTYIYGKLSTVLYLTGTVNVSLPFLLCVCKCLWHISVSCEPQPGITLYSHNRCECCGEGQERKGTQHTETCSVISLNAVWTLPPGGSAPDWESCSVVTDQPYCF